MASEAPRTLPCWPSLTANLLGSGGWNPCGGLNSGGGSGAEVAAVSGWALTATREVALARAAAALAEAGRRGRRRGAAGGAAAGAMDCICIGARRRLTGDGED